MRVECRTWKWDRSEFRWEVWNLARENFRIGSVVGVVAVRVFGRIREMVVCVE